MSNIDLRAPMEHTAKKIKVNQLLAPTHPRTLQAHAPLLSQVLLGPFFRTLGRKGIELKQVRSIKFFALCGAPAFHLPSIPQPLVPLLSPLPRR